VKIETARAAVNAASAMTVRPCRALYRPPAAPAASSRGAKLRRAVRNRPRGADEIFTAA